MMALQQKAQELRCWFDYFALEKVRGGGWFFCFMFCLAEMAKKVSGYINGLYNYLGIVVYLFNKSDIWRYWR